MSKYALESGTYDIEYNEGIGGFGSCYGDYKSLDKRCKKTKYFDTKKELRTVLNPKANYKTLRIFLDTKYMARQQMLIHWII